MNNSNGTPPPIFNAATKSRIEYIDLLKAFGIFCVLWFHAIGNLNDAGSSINSERYFAADPLHLFFVTFHMPLFFMISGFFFASSLHLDFKNVIRKRFTTLIIPYLVWSLITSLANWAVTLVGWTSMFYKPFTIAGQLEALLRPNPATDMFWFFKDLFLTDLIVFISYKLFRKRSSAFIASMIFVLLVDCFGVVGKMQRFMMPIFWTGILLKTYYPVFCKHINTFLIGFGILFAVCVYFFHYTYMIYLMDFPPLINFSQSLAEGKIVFDVANIGVSVFRSFTGIAGSLFFFALFYRCWRKNAVTSTLSRCGQLTLGIYAIHFILLGRVISNLLDFSNGNKWLYWMVVTPCTAAFVFFVCTLLVLLIQKNRLLTFVLFGSSLVRRNSVYSVAKDAIVNAHPRKILVPRDPAAEALAAEKSNGKARVMEARAMEALAAEVLELEARAVEALAFEALAVTARAAEALAVAARMAEARALEAGAAEALAAEARVAEALALEAHALEARAAEAFGSEARAVGAGTAEARPTETRTSNTLAKEEDNF